MTIAGTGFGAIAMFAVALRMPSGCSVVRSPGLFPPTIMILGRIRPTGPLRAGFRPIAFKNRA
jgi:hypothetical protein